MGELRINVSNFLAVGIIAFIFVFAVNKTLDTIDQPQYKA